MSTGIEKNKRFTPLGIIALFVSLAELIAGIIATQTHDTVQLVLTCFVVFFPIFVSSLFFLVLWHRPENFYHPEEFVEGADVRTFTEAMRRRFKRISHYEEKLESTVATAMKEIEGSTNEMPENVASKLIEQLEKTEFITIDTTPILGAAGRVFKVDYNEFESIGLFLLFLWDEVGTLPVSSYLKSWIIRDGNSGNVFSQIGTKYARRVLKTSRDERTLEEAGIKPGMLIEVDKP